MIILFLLFLVFIHFYYAVEVLFGVLHSSEFLLRKNLIIKVLGHSLRRKEIPSFLYILRSYVPNKKNDIYITTSLKVFSHSIRNRKNCNSFSEWLCIFCLRGCLSELINHPLHKNQIWNLLSIWSSCNKFYHDENP